MKDYIKDPELMSLMPELKDEELNTLRNNINRDGFKGDPITIWKGKDIIVDGHHRYDICKELGVEGEIVEREFKDKEDAITWMINIQLGRRNLNSAQRIKLARRLRPEIEKAAKEKQKKAGGDRKSAKYKKSVQLNSAEADKSESVQLNSVGANQACATANETISILAEYADVGRDTYRKGERVYNSDDEELKAKMESGEISVSAAYNELKRQERAKEESVEEHTIGDSEKPLAAECITEPKQKLEIEEHMVYLKEQFAKISKYILPYRKRLRKENVKYCDKHNVDIDESTKSDIYYYFNNLSFLCKLIASMELDVCDGEISITIND